MESEVQALDSYSEIVTLKEDPIAFQPNHCPRYLLHTCKTINLAVIQYKQLAFKVKPTPVVGVVNKQ